MKTTYTFALEGHSRFISEASTIREDLLEPLLENDEWEYSSRSFENIPSLKLDFRPKALGGLEVAGAVMLFLGTCFAKKVFDEFYDRLLKRPVGEMVDMIIKKVKLPDHAYLEYRDIVYFEDIDTSVVIRLLLKTTEGIDVDSLLLEGHKAAHEYLEAHGKKAEIHCHKIVDGKLDVNPGFFSSLDHIKASDREQLKTQRKF
ncbi:hypothetical protein [Pseudomonas frederiksbergensis]|uniref:Uncharacterized protein n=1 Tax=Pseudomonas frederiksbergensis TaxID=104087 RepID=A0A6L5BUJ4_9PSED|nr:hypothetical protein [Pseudomonas frederiksbergensis]KAF2390794.1 hypothetical protein FX983_05261 [Pseudomonas frederiksbergensis]